VGEPWAFHTYATWNGWTFDHAGWNREPQLMAVNTAFEGRPLERLEITALLTLPWVICGRGALVGVRRG
jgi:hypothetical protein